jgi:hypothetical protein
MMIRGISGLRGFLGFTESGSKQFQKQEKGGA